MKKLFAIFISAFFLAGCIDSGYVASDPYALRAAGQQAVSQADSAIAATQAAQFERSQSATLEAERTQSALQVQAQQAAIVATATANEFAASSSRATATQDAMMAMSAAATAGAIQAETTQSAALRVSGLYATMTVQMAVAGAAADAVKRNAEWDQATDTFLRCIIGSVAFAVIAILIVAIIQSWFWLEARREWRWMRESADADRRRLLDTASHGPVGYINGQPALLAPVAQAEYYNRPRQNLSAPHPSDIDQAEMIEQPQQQKPHALAADAWRLIGDAIDVVGNTGQNIPRYERLGGMWAKNSNRWVEVTNWLEEQGAIIKNQGRPTLLSSEWGTLEQLQRALLPAMWNGGDLKSPVHSPTPNDDG